MVTVHNKTLKEVAIIDHYLTDLELKLGYDGATEYRIPGGKKKSISSSIYLRQMEEEKKTQEIHVRSGEDTKLVLHHEDFENNEEIFFETHEGSIIPRYSPKTGTSFAVRIRGIFRFCGPGLSTTSPGSRV